jgi:hypothetical protein
VFAKSRSRDIYWWTDRKQMIFSEEHEADIEGIVQAGPAGAIVVAGTATAIVIALWFAFYLFVFLPRGVIQ